VLARRLPRVRDFGDLPHCHCHLADQAIGAVRKGRLVREAAPKLLLVALGVAALGLVPTFAPPFYANLLIPFFAYAIALIGFNLLFGYTGLLSFGHAMYLGLGAYAEIH